MSIRSKTFVNLATENISGFIFNLSAPGQVIETLPITHPYIYADGTSSAEPRDPSPTLTNSQLRIFNSNASLSDVIVGVTSSGDLDELIIVGTPIAEGAPLQP